MQIKIMQFIIDHLPLSYMDSVKWLRYLSEDNIKMIERRYNAPGIVSNFADIIERKKE